MFEGLFQPTHLIIILVIVLIVFGPGKLPEIGGAVGKSVREFRRSTAGETTPENVPQAASTGTAEPHTTCAECHTDNPPTSKFCGGCGKELAA